MVSVSVSKNFGIKKSIGIGFEKFWYRKKYRYRFRKILVSRKVSVSVSKNFGNDKSIGIGFEKNLVSKKVSDSVSKNSGIEKSIGIGIGKKLVSKKVSDSVSKIFGIRKKFRIRFRSDFGFRNTLLHMFVRHNHGILCVLYCMMF